MQEIKIEKQCLVCQKNFQTLEGNQRRCPACIDRIKGHEAQHITTSRREIETHIVRNLLPESLFCPWSTGDHKDLSARRAILKGRDFGWGEPYVVWGGVNGGRIDVWILDRVPSGVKDERPLSGLVYPSVVRFRLMETTKAAPSEKPADEWRGVERPALPLAQTWKYVALDWLPDDTPIEEIEGELRLLVASRKTTLKGLGAQWEEKLDVSSTLWHYDMSGECRSGRYGSRSSLCIVSPSHPAFFTNREGDTIQYPAAEPEI